jgi:hypothetical protein
MKELIGEVTASSHQIYDISHSKKAGVYNNLAMPFNPDNNKCFVFNMQEDYSLWGQEIEFDRAMKL